MWGYLAVLVVGLLIGAAGFGALDDPFALALAVLVCGAAAILVKPILGVYLTVFFSVLGDTQTMLGYPFNSNFSSRESILYIHNSLTFSPVELFLALTAVSWFAHTAGARNWRLRGRPLLLPVVGLGLMVGVGLVYGVGLRGGNLTVAIWELRPLLYLVVMYVLASNLFPRVEHYVYVAWAVVLAIAVQNIFAIHYYFTLSRAERATLEALTEHPSSLFYAWLFLLALAVCLLKSCSRVARFLIVLTVLPTAYLFVLSERRAAAVALAVGFIVFAFILFFRRRKAFFVLVPAVLLLSVAYTAAFWNSSEGAGFGARAVKTVFAPKSVSERDASSDVYRIIENYDLVYTIRVAPQTGVGFGRPFYQPAQLPNISFFVFSQYIPHNSILWIWLKMGYVGFVALLFLIAATLRAGTRASLALPSGDALAVTVGALAFIVMFFVFAYVDIAWGPRTCLFLAVCMATCVNMPRLAGVDRRGSSEKEAPSRVLQA
jgi:hypothetical protein